MPIGISFFTFQSLSYVIDVYRGTVKAQKNIYHVALYISFFPQLIAGPIVKYHDIEYQIEFRRETITNFYEGAKRFSFGLGKKIIIANTLGKVADEIFALEINELDWRIAWIGIICYSLQIYFDFSGYSDMAIGLGKLFGFNFLENFNYPYISKSITEFWRRWHISLSTWFKEYLYIPLGGNRKSVLRTYINLLIVFLVTGAWHGASWTFIVWGLWHGLFIILEKLININRYQTLPQRIFRHFYTIIIFLLGWVFFRSDKITYAFNYIKVMFGLRTGDMVGFTVMYWLDRKIIGTIILGILGSTGALRVCMSEDSKKCMVFDVMSLIVTAYSIILIGVSSYNPFIYFRF
jgi:alginate O-acetyltransferase complex protein AlgI